LRENAEKIAGSKIKKIFEVEGGSIP